MRPYWLDRTEMRIPTFGRGVFEAALDKCPELVELGDVARSSGAVELAGAAVLACAGAFDPAVLPHAASAVAAPTRVIAISRLMRTGCQREEVASSGDLRGGLVV